MNNIIVIKDPKFNSVNISVNFLMPLKKDEVSKNALTALLLKQGCRKYTSEQEIETELSKLYASSINVGVDKVGYIYDIEVSCEFINKKYINEDVTEKVIDILREIIYNPLIEENSFNNDYVEREKANLIDRINEEKNDKRRYALRRLEQEMFKDYEYGINVLGIEEDIVKQDGKTLYEHYNKILSEAEIKIIITGNIDGYEDLETMVKNKLLLEYNSNNFKNRVYFKKDKKTETVSQTIEKEKLNQSILGIGLNVGRKNMYVASVYNAILGETPSSKLFQNVREKESLAYFSKSQYLRHVGAIYIYSGINHDKVEKAKQVILKQIKDMSDGIISEEEFESAKKHVISTYKAIADNKNNIAKMAIGNYIFFGKNVDINDYIQGFEKVTLSQVIEFANTIKIDTIYLLGGEDDE